MLCPANRANSSQEHAVLRVADGAKINPHSYRAEAHMLYETRHKVVPCKEKGPRSPRA